MGVGSKARDPKAPTMFPGARRPMASFPSTAEPPPRSLSALGRPSPDPASALPADRTFDQPASPIARSDDTGSTLMPSRHGALVGRRHLPR